MSRSVSTSLPPTWNPDFNFDDPTGANSLFVSAPGQSGNAMSEWYDNMLPIWADGDYQKMHTLPGAGGYRVEKTQTLLPS